MQAGMALRSILSSLMHGPCELLEIRYTSNGKRYSSELPIYVLETSAELFQVLEVASIAGMHITQRRSLRWFIGLRAAKSAAARVVEQYMH